MNVMWETVFHLKWRRVTGPVSTVQRSQGQIRVRLHIRHHDCPRIPPNEVSIKRNGVWREMTKSSDGYWVLSDGVEMTNTNDIPVRVTAINGEQLSDTVPQLGKPAMFKTCCCWQVLYPHHMPTRS